MRAWQSHGRASERFDLGASLRVLRTTLQRDAADHKAALGNVDALELPFVWRYTLEAQDCARTTGNLLLVRPRIVGSLARDTDVFDIGLPLRRLPLLGHSG
jgi:hypothetical protein